MKITKYIILVLLFFSCSNSKTENSPKIDEFISELNNKSLDEIKVEVNSNIEQFEAIMKFFDGSLTNEIETVDKEDERYGEEFNIDTSGIDKALQGLKNVVFLQSFLNNESQLEFEIIDQSLGRPSNLGEGIQQEFIPNKIFYHDGEVKSDSISDYEVDFSFDESWGIAKPIDSIYLTHQIEYINDHDVITLSSDNTKANYKGGEIELVKKEGNYIYLALNDTIPEPIVVEGLNKEGKVLSRSGSSNSSVAPGKSKGAIEEFIDFFKDVQEKLNDNDFENTDEFQKYLKKNLTNIDFINDTDGRYHREKYYYGNVNSVKLYFPKETKIEEQKVIAKNAFPDIKDNELFEMQTEDGLAFIDTNGKSKIKIPNSDIDIDKIGGNFFEDQNYFYFLNKKESKLDTLLIYDLKVHNNGLVSVQFEDEEEDYSIYNSNYKPISNTVYWFIKEVDNTLFGLRDDNYYVIDTFGKETLVKGVKKVYDKLSNDRIMVSNEGKYGFINAKGKVIIPMKYDDAKDFEDSITAVKLNGTYKLIDVNGKVITDTKEDYINFFDTDSDGKRIYRFDNGNKMYNYKGEPILD